MIQGLAQMPDVEVGIMRDHDVGAASRARNSGAWREIPGHPELSRCVKRESQCSRRETIRAVFGGRTTNKEFGQIAILKNGQPGGANAHARAIGRFQIYADEIHGLRECFWRFLRAAPLGTGGHGGKPQQVFAIGKFQNGFFSSGITKSVLVPDRFLRRPISF